jgi:hypothetical protein
VIDSVRRWAGFKRTADSRTFSALDFISEDVVADAQVIATPAHDARPSQAAEEAADTLAPPRAGNATGDDACERSQKALKSLSPARPHEQMQVCADIRVIVDPHTESPRHLSQRVAHGSLMPAQRPGAFGPPTRKHDVHGPSGADRPLELPLTAPHVPAVFASSELGTNLATEKRSLHEGNIS